MKDCQTPGYQLHPAELLMCRRVPSCVCGWRPPSRYGTRARAELLDHAQHSATVAGMGGSRYREPAA